MSYRSEEMSVNCLYVKDLKKLVDELQLKGVQAELCTKPKGIQNNAN